MTRWKSDLILLLVAALWGTGFVAQRLATTQLGTFFFNGGRFLLAGGMIFILTRLRGAKKADKQEAIAPPNQMRWMVLAGVLLFAGAGLQQAGLITTSIGNASFITGLYVVLVPLILFVVWRQRIDWLSWLAVGIATCGVTLLSLQGTLHFAYGDVLELIGAVLWAVHVILVGRLAGQGVDVLKFSVIQFTVCGILNLALAFGLDPQGGHSLVDAWPVVVYSALLPIGAGFTLQITGQRHAPPVDAAIILSMEAVFGTLFGFLFLNELLTLRQLVGCGLILAAMILAQVRPAEAPLVDTVINAQEQES